jgi:hypothetical protein
MSLNTGIEEAGYDPSPKSRLYKFTLMDALIQIFDAIQEEMTDYNVVMGNNSPYNILRYSLLKCDFSYTYKKVKNYEYWKKCLYQTCWISTNTMSDIAVEFKAYSLRELVESLRVSLVPMGELHTLRIEHDGTKEQRNSCVETHYADAPEYRFYCMRNNTCLQTYIRFYSLILDRLIKTRG